jgi:uncharacterized protein HemX
MSKFATSESQCAIFKLMNNRGFAPIIVLLAIVALLVLATGVWYYTDQKKMPTSIPPTEPAASVSSTPSTPSSTANTNSVTTAQQAIEIAARYSKTDLANVQAWATQGTSTWKVYFAPKQSGGGGIISGGNSEYIIDSRTGVVISVLLGQ